MRNSLENLKNRAVERDLRPALSSYKNFKMSRLKDLPFAFSERLGLDYVPTLDQFKIYKNWLFFKNEEYPNEIEIYQLPMPVCLECYDECSFEESPFKPENDNIVNKLISKLNQSLN